MIGSYESSLARNTEDSRGSHYLGQDRFADRTAEPGSIPRAKDFAVEHRAFGEVTGADEFDWPETALRQSGDGKHGEGDRLHLDQDGR